MSQADNSSLIQLDGSVDISDAAELKSALLAAMEGGREIRLSVEAADGLDITAFQLLWAAAREARQAGTGFALTGSIPESMQASLASMGWPQFLNSSFNERIAG